MSEHVHLEAMCWAKGSHMMVRSTIRRKHADREVEIVKSMGYDVEALYCGDPLCLGPEPRSRYDK